MQDAGGEATPALELADAGPAVEPPIEGTADADVPVEAPIDEIPDEVAPVDPPVDDGLNEAILAELERQAERKQIQDTALEACSSLSESLVSCEIDPSVRSSAEAECRWIVKYHLRGTQGHLDTLKAFTTLLKDKRVVCGDLQIRGAMSAFSRYRDLAHTFAIDSSLIYDRPGLQACVVHTGDLDRCGAYTVGSLQHCTQVAAYCSDECGKADGNCGVRPSTGGDSFGIYPKWCWFGLVSLPDAGKALATECLMEYEAHRQCFDFQKCLTDAWDATMPQ
jgi:hypothetical protein